MMCAAMDQNVLMLKEVAMDLDRLEKSLQKGVMLHTPTNDIDECCSLSVLECFRGNVNLLQATQKKLQHKLFKKLMNPMIVSNMNFCTLEETQKAICPPCNSYPKRNSEQFVKELRLLLQKATARLTWKQTRR
ncbi:interleukin-21 isoform X2 [Anguilla rostrata]|uniref:Interleukin-21 n=2 Tax=Anguilla anguilla TaxID=7936 RepID=A0A9D3MGG1_ANGAN|nr:interleukin-21 isoform X2 [Anguilla anguilla]XP_035283088.1 interleukin-21 isoform X2 [Anguilla anguilla]XP_035283089.1 interleukin-21 isoform X2 [Anguilla anguilla]XP_035283090.1 interleukin-21 isoform X2 [Anguilla anguilla]KAG5845453.1 hypothetical protein ANANG_G00139270 [Anguilla anguilla]